MDYRTYILWGAALLLAGITFLLSRKWDFSLKRSAANRLERFADKDKRDVADKLGDTVLPGSTSCAGHRSAANTRAKPLEACSESASCWPGPGSFTSYCSRPSALST
jgi:hypothetical protein